MMESNFILLVIYDRIMRATIEMLPRWVWVGSITCGRGGKSDSKTMLLKQKDTNCVVQLGYKQTKRDEFQLNVVTIISEERNSRRGSFVGCTISGRSLCGGWGRVFQRYKTRQQTNSRYPWLSGGGWMKAWEGRNNEDAPHYCLRTRT